MNNIYIHLIIITILYVIIISPKPQTKKKKSSSAKIKGEIGENKISNILKTLPKEHYKLINNVLLKRKKGNVNSSQIDHIVVSTYGIFVIETKNFNGIITGNDNSKEWTQHLNKKFSFYSPTRQNYGHVKALEESLELPEDIFIPIVVFLSNATLKVTSKYHVINDTELKKSIFAYRTQKLDTEQVNTIEKQIKNLNTYSSKTMKKHVKDINRKYNKIGIIGFTDLIMILNTIKNKIVNTMKTIKAYDIPSKYIFIFLILFLLLLLVIYVFFHYGLDMEIIYS